MDPRAATIDVINRWARRVIRPLTKGPPLEAFAPMQSPNACSEPSAAWMKGLACRGNSPRPLTRFRMSAHTLSGSPKGPFQAEGPGAAAGAACAPGSSWATAPVQVLPCILCLCHLAVCGSPQKRQVCERPQFPSHGLSWLNLKHFCAPSTVQSACTSLLALSL